MKFFIQIQLLTALLVIAYAKSQCGKISGPDSKGILKTIDLSTIPTIRWDANPPSSYELKICQNELSCKDGQHSFLQYWEGQCFYLGKAEQTSMRLIDPNDISRGVIMQITGGEPNEQVEGNPPRSAIITFSCGSSDPGYPKYIREGVEAGQYIYHFEWITKKACVDEKEAADPNPPRFRIPYVGIGGLVLIIGTVGIFAYFAVGIALNKFKFKKTGLDIIPHGVLLISLPGLVKDGVIYFISFFKREKYNELK